MLNNKAWYHQTIKNYVIAFAKIFDDIEIAKFDSDGKFYSFHKVPIMYMNKSKLYAIKEQRSTDYGITNIFPRMTFRLGSMIRDRDRQKYKTNKIIAQRNGNNLSVFTPKPYNFDFTLSIFTRNVKHLTKLTY